MDVSRPVLMTLILHFLTSLPLKRTLILAESLTSDPYNRGFLFRRKSVYILRKKPDVFLSTGCKTDVMLFLVNLSPFISLGVSILVFWRFQGFSQALLFFGLWLQVFGK